MEKEAEGGNGLLPEGGVSMNRMKKQTALLILLALTVGMLTGASAAKLDRSEYVIASGTVAAAAFENVTAPFSGTLLPFDWEAGDRVSDGETLFRTRTLTLRAPAAGTVTAVFAGEGENAEGAMSRFGALAAIEHEYSYLINASAGSAYNKSKNRELHIGETLYFRSTAEGREEGSGTVISVTGENYTVEIRDGSFNTRETLSLYRTDDYAAADKVGSGTVIRRDPLTVTGGGRILKVYVKPGDTVVADEPMFEMMSADAEPESGDGIASPCDGVLTAVAVQPGQQVWKGALLCRISRTDRLEVVAELDEMDLGKIQIGSVCPVVLDMDEDTVMQGRVTEISALGFARQNAAWFRVHLALEGAADLPLGASASVYLPK